MIKDITKQVRITSEENDKLDKILKARKITFSEWFRKVVKSARLK